MKELENIKTLFDNFISDAEKIIKESKEDKPVPLLDLYEKGMAIWVRDSENYPWAIKEFYKYDPSWNYPWFTNSVSHWQYVKPFTPQWYPWDGRSKAGPEVKGNLVVKHRDGCIPNHISTANGWHWLHDRGDEDIIAFCPLEDQEWREVGE